MSIKDLFEKNIATMDSAASGSSKTESYDFVLSKNEKNNKFIPRVDYSSASNFSFYGSAELYYSKSIERIYNNYPYDGSKNEKVTFHLSSSQFEEWLYNNLYPKTNGYINMSYGGWGAQSSITSGYGLPVNIEYIYSRGGMHTASGGMIGKELFKTFDKSVKYDSENKRETTYNIDMSKGITLEFWLQKAAFDISKTEKEVILDLWNSEISSSNDYGRFTLALTSSGEADGSNTFLVTMQSGTVGFFEQTIGDTTVTTGSLVDWHHYAFSFISASSGVESRIYVDGNLNQKTNLGSAGINDFGGLVNGYIGALQASPSSSAGVLTKEQLKYAGKFSGSLDEFRFWKIRRTSEQIASNWNQNVGAGTNTDTNNTDLGVYYKFNEGIVGSSSYDSEVLDYSGRIANGTWTGYSAGARNTGSAMVLSGLTVSEEKDPIIYSVHPDVVTLNTNLALSGSERDADNGNMLINKFPNWLIEEDEEINSNFKFLTQTISSFLDELYLDISELKRLKFAEYYSADYKALPFANRLITERGIDAKDILNIATTLEKYEKRNIDSTILENDISNVKNIIYQNIYNNIPKILKSKGTERSFRNMLRCFGFDDEIVKLNIYTNKGTQRFTDKYKVSSFNKKTIDFANSNSFDGIVFQTSSANNSRTYIYGSDSSKSERYNAMTFEINVLMPYKTPSSDDGYVHYGQLTSSIGGFHEAIADSADYSFATNNIASLQIFAIRDELDSDRAKFMLKSHDGSISLSSSLYFDVYENSLWTLAARVKPVGYPFYGSYSSADQEYVVDFYGVRHKAGEVEDFFHLTSSVSYASGSSFLSNRKRVFVGANRTNFTGSSLQNSDVKVSNCRFYLDYLDNSVLNEHNKDITIHGSNKSFEGNTAFGLNLDDKRISSLETIALNWDFNKVTGSTSSGDYIVQDISSGSTDTLYGWIDEIIRREHRGIGYGFSNSDTSFLSREYLTLYRKELPEVSYTADNIKIAGIEEEAFLTDKDVSDSFYALEKSMYQVVSEKMLETLSSTSEMNNLIGKSVERYRMNYKSLDYARRIFFDKVEEDPDFDKFTEYFRWIDKSIYSFVKDLIPASVSFADNISDTVESHIFERNKVRTLLPNRFVEVQPDDHVNGIRELSYNWKFGHAPLPTSTTDAAFSNISFTANHSGGTHEDSLQLTASSQTHLSVYADPNQALTIDPSTIDHLIYTGSTGLAFKANGTTQAYASSNPYSGLLTNNLSISFMLSGSGGDINQFEFRDGSVYTYQINVEEDFTITVTTDSNNSTVTFDTNHLISNGWSHYVVVFDGKNQPILYKNGDASTASGYSTPAGTIGTIDKFFTYIDQETALQDIIIWNKQLTSADVLKLYNGGVWLNPTSVSASSIDNWYKFGYEDYWTGSAGDTLAAAETVSSSYAGGGGTKQHLSIPIAQASQFEFTTGDNPFNTTKSEAKIYEELTSSLNTKFLSIYGETTKTGTAPDVFTMQSASIGSNTTLTATGNGTGFFSATPTVNTGSDFSQTFPQNTKCLWRREREIRTDIAERETIRKVIENDNNQKANTLVDSGGSTYEGSTYALRKLSRVYKESVSMVPSFHGGINYEIQKNREAIYVNTSPHSPLTAIGIPKNVIMIGGGAGQGVELSVDCIDVEDPNKKEKFNIKAYLGKFSNGSGESGTFSEIDDTVSFAFGVKGARSLPFSIFSGSNSTGYNSIFSSGFRSDAYITNIHSDTTNHRNDVPMQGPFAERWVGGHQSRHIDINRYNLDLFDSEAAAAPENNLHNIYTRAEAYRILLVESDGTGSDGAVGLTDPQYGQTGITGHPHNGKYPDVAKKKAVYFREERAKRPINIKNIQTTTGSYSHGNYREQYEILSVASGKQHNNPLLRTNVDSHNYLPTAIKSILPQTTNYKSLVGIGHTAAGNVYGAGASNVLDTATETSIATGSIQKSVISTRFSAPGGIETMTYGFLDAYNHEMSPYNALTYRNLLVRGSGSGEAGTIRLNDHLGNRHGLLTHLSRHSGKFGADSVYGSVTTGDYVTIPSYHKIPRNTARKPASDSSLSSPTFNLDHDNFFVRSTIPRSDYQYSWVTSSLGSNYSINSGKQRMFGYAPRDGIMSSSYEVHGETGYVGAITFPTASELFGE